MLQARATSATSTTPPHLGGLLFSALENTEVGAIVIDSDGRAAYMNDAARTLLSSHGDTLPPWALRYVQSMLRTLDETGASTERWEHDSILLRVTARPLARAGWRAILQITVARSLDGAEVIPHLSRSLKLPPAEAQLLALLWRGLGNDEIADILSVKVATIEARLYFLYEKLGVEWRPAAVMRAAKALAA